MFDFGRVSPFEEEWAIHQKSKRIYRGGVSSLKQNPFFVSLRTDLVPPLFQKIDEYVFETVFV